MSVSDNGSNYKRVRPIVPKLPPRTNLEARHDQCRAADLRGESMERQQWFHQEIQKNNLLGTGLNYGGSSQHQAVSSRWNPTVEQLRLLEDLYKRGIRTPSAEQIQHITRQLRCFGKIEGKNVFYWFQNHKARERQKRRRKIETMMLVGSAEYPSMNTQAQTEGISTWSVPNQMASRTPCQIRNKFPTKESEGFLKLATPSSQEHCKTMENDYSYIPFRNDLDLCDPLQGSYTHLQQCKSQTIKWNSQSVGSPHVLNSVPSHPEYQEGFLGEAHGCTQSRSSSESDHLRTLELFPLHSNNSKDNGVVKSMADTAQSYAFDKGIISCHASSSSRYSRNEVGHEVETTTLRFEAMEFKYDGQDDGECGQIQKNLEEEKAPCISFFQFIPLHH